MRPGAKGRLTTVLAVLVTALVLTLSSRHPVRIDLSAGSHNSLAEQTVKVLKELKEPVEALGFFQVGDPTGRRIGELLERYAYQGERFTYRLIDPDRNPTLAGKYGIKGYGTVVLVSGERSRKVSPPDEESLTNGLISLVRERVREVFITVGHGERRIDEAGPQALAQAGQELRRRGYRVETLVLMNQPLPAPGATILIAGPKAKFAPQEVDRLKEFTRAGGRLLILLDPGTDAGLKEFLTGLGLDLAPNIVIDKMSRLMGTEPTIPVVSEFEPHPITEGFKLTAFFPLARSIRPLKDRAEDLAVTPLAKTNRTAWGETDLKRLRRGEAELEEADLAGPTPIGLVVERVKPEGQPQNGFRLVIFGDSDFVTNANFNLAGHRDLFLNCLAWLAADEELITIRAKTGLNRPAFLTVGQSRLVFWLSVAALPGLVGLIGLIVLVRRWRRK